PQPASTEFSRVTPWRLYHSGRNPTPFQPLPQAALSGQSYYPRETCALTSRHFAALQSVEPVRPTPVGQSRSDTPQRRSICAALRLSARRESAAARVLPSQTA